MKHEREIKIKSSILILAILSIGIGYYIARAANWGFSGFSWIGNNLQNGVEQGDPAIGMVSMKGVNYNVIISGEGEQRPLVGSAWMGIGSTDDKFNDFTGQNDYPSIGWIHFNQPFDQDKLDTLITGKCFGASDCHGVRWNKKPGSADGYEGYLSGWARMEIGPNGDGTTYPDTWVHFKSPGNTSNYNCNEGDNNYYVCVDPNGRLEGFAWSAGATHVSIDSNPGLGWIRFSKKFSGLETSGQIPAHTTFCTTLLDPDSQSVACKNSEDFTGKFRFKAYQSGFTLNKFDPNSNFQWTNCGEDGAPKVGETITCEYKNDGIFTPELKIYDEALQKWSGTGDIPGCANQNSVKVTSEATCSILIRKAGTESKDKGSKSLTINQDENAEAIINRQCLTGGDVKWTLTGGSKLYESSESLGIKPNGAMIANVTAQITKEGRTINCGTTTLNVKETVRWR